MSILWRTALAIGLVGLLAACASPQAGQLPASGTAPQAATGAPRGAKTMTIGVSSGVQSFGIMGSASGAGGWDAMVELFAEGLVTADVHSRQPVGRLAARLPSLDDGSIAMLPDGRMKVVYTIRQGVTWQDGVPFTAHDLVFSAKLDGDTGLPTIDSQATRLIDSFEAPDDSTFILYFKGPYYLGGVLGPQLLWPEPEHLLGDAYARYLDDKNPDDVAALPYWSTGYVNLTPFKLTAFDPGTSLTMQAYDGYFLGRPKIDTVLVRIFGDGSALYANLLAGTADIFTATAISQEQSFQLKDQWESTGQGRVVFAEGNMWFLSPQARPAMQTEPANLDPRVRAALYLAVDRETLTELLLNGRKNETAYSLLPPSDPLYEVTKDSMRPYAYDSDRARAQLADLGWILGADGSLHNTADGRAFKNTLSATAGQDRAVAFMADNWRKIGLQVDELIIPQARARDLQFRASYPNWEYSTGGWADQVLGRVAAPAASAANRWSGSNRGGYEDPQLQALIDVYRASPSIQEQRREMQAISDYFVDQLPFLPLYFNPLPIGVRTGIRAFDDLEGGADGAPYGTPTRDAYLWDVDA